MKLKPLLLMCVGVMAFGAAARADMWSMLIDFALVRSGAVSPFERSGRDTSPVETAATVGAVGAMSVGGVAGYNMAMTRYQANEVLNTAAMMAIVGTSANGGMGKDMTLAEFDKEMGQPSDKFCNVDMKGTKAGVVTVTFGDPCVTAKGEKMNPAAVMEQVQKLSGKRASCSGNTCLIDMMKSVR